MDYDKRYMLKYLLFLVFLIVLVPSCQEEPQPSSPSEITKAQRTQLGNTFAEVIESEKEFELLSRDEPANRAALDWMETIYNQAILVIRDDDDDPDADQWDDTRRWKVNILVSDDIIAFCLPGGDFYITTKFLQEINYESELFYIMAFEAHLMDERFLLNQLIPIANSSNNLVEIGLSGEGDGIYAIDILREIYSNIVYNDPINTVKLIDEMTVNTICQRSTYRRTGAVDLEISPLSLWYTTRPNYVDRRNNLENDLLLRDSNGDCLGNNFFIDNSDFYYTLIDDLVF